MSAYRLVERDLYTHQPHRIWDEVDGHDMTASQAEALLLRIAAQRPELHEPGAGTYLETEPIVPPSVAVLADVLLGETAGPGEDGQP